jgi:hypothetical protein
MEKKNLKNKGQVPRGQVMLLSALLIGGSILAATSVAGYLMLLQIRQSTNIANSAKAITAASTGIDWALYQHKIGNDNYPPYELNLDNDSRVKITKNGSVISSVGNSGDSYRAFSIDISVSSVLPEGE